MEQNPYESPKAECIPLRRAADSNANDWFSLVGLVVGSVAAVAVGLAIRSQRVPLGDSWLGWLLFGTTTTVGLIAIAGWFLGKLRHRHTQFHAMRYRLRTLLILLAIGPMMLAYFIALVLAARDAAVQARTHKPTVTTRLLLPRP